MKRVQYAKTWMILAVAFCAAASVYGQFPSVRGYVDKKQQLLPVDYAAFVSDSAGLVRLEIYYQVFNHVLQFEKREGLFEARYEVAVSVRDDDGRQVASDKSEGEIKTAGERRTRSTADYRTRQAVLDLPPGKYEVVVTLRDTQTRKTITHDLDIKLKNRIGRFPCLSDIELIQLAERGTEPSEIFAKGDMNLVPSVSGVMGGADEPRLLYYVEIYRGRDETDDVFTETILRTHGGKMVYRDSLTVPLTEWRTRQLRDVSIAQLRPGAYELEIILRGRRNKKLDERHKPFHVAWTAEALVTHHYETAVDQLEYIATGEETEQLRKLKTTEERKEGFEEFWKNHDPTPETPENELRSEFYERVSVANRRFSVYNREGWRTDRGRIYIQYGEPDQIDDQPVALGGRPYQRWYYYRYGAYRVFTFVDEYEDGDYRLQYPYDGLY
ncbi:MAG: GWxTD domain-containing protein [Candidatus Zixiibacteriota bacterium]